MVHISMHGHGNSSWWGPQKCEIWLSIDGLHNPYIDW